MSTLDRLRDAGVLPREPEPFDPSKLKEHTLYEVRVSWGSGNPIHKAFLFMGFRSGGYCRVYTNNYDGSKPAQQAYWIEVGRELAGLKEE